MSLRVYRKHSRGDDKQFLCQLPDGTIAGLPTWMMDADCDQYSIGEPMVSLDALRSLRVVLNSLQRPPKCDKASQNSLEEGVHGKRREA